jgi:hypothetical protein
MSEPSARHKRTHSSVSKLPPEVQAAITERLNAGATYQDIVDHLHAMGHAVSRSAVGRWGLALRTRQEHLEASADLACLLTEKLGAEQLEEAATVLALELVVNTLMQHDDITTGDEGLYLPHVTQLLSALARVSTANLVRDKWNADVERKAQEAADAVSRQARSEGLSDETVELIKARILGISEEVG